MITSRLFFAFALFLTIFSVAAQTPGEDRNRILAELKPYRQKALTKDLNLTRDQAREFFPLYDAMDDELNQIQSDTRELERSTIKDQSATDAEIEAAARAIFAQKQKEATVEMEYFEKFRQVLTPRQLLNLKNAERRFTQSLIKKHRRMTRTKTNHTEDNQ